ncbi:HsdR family type I site-specific deoxyribonuclease [uncultured Brachyspira sp.]|uniref:type I restriction endonuclease subunit R n=1 Tax=uncultured Brachyspira sp. TaxID=221953 RepID=UPI0026076E74|nr:HsdR family type I site-specific deoxyribonuclease [uncultured Brachyspira sp.]
MNEQYSERVLQNKVIELFKSMGYQYISYEDALKERNNDTNNVLFKNILEEQLKKINYFMYDGKKNSFSIDNIKKAADDLDIPLIKGYLITNEEITERILKGESYKEKIGNKQESFNIKYIDFDNIENNIFHITEEFIVNRSSLEEKEKTRRPDLVVFINGIPIAVIELKKGSVDSKNAVEQMIRNQEEKEIRQLFKFSQLLICANDDMVKYGTAGTPAKLYNIWKDKENNDNKRNKHTERAEKEKIEESKVIKELKKIVKDRTINEIDITLYSLFQKERLFDILEYFIIFDGTVKKAARYNQYFAVKKTMERVQNIVKGKRQGGVIWHTQGSGKSLTMSMLTKIISRKIKNSKIVVVTDRVDLDEQIHSTFKNTDISAARASTGANLIKLIESGKSVITTVINKFEKVFDKKVVIDSSDIFILVDESHRTQYGNFAMKMRNVFPNACYLGFTGTPLYKSEKSTAEKFGGFIDSYTIRDALKDKVIVPLYYESRFIEQKIYDKKGIDYRYDLITKDLTDKEKEDLKNKKVTEKVILESEQRLIVLADDIAKHYKKNLEDTEFNAMLAVSSKYQAMKMKEIFDSYHKLETAVVISSQIDEGEDKEEHNKKNGSEKKKYVSEKWKELYSKYSNDENKYIEETIKSFKKGSIDILIVVDKLLTGFDAPRAQVLYIDKELKDHSLLQAIARVNRTYTGKDNGILIDYRGLLKNLDNALNTYDKLANYDLEDIEDAVFDIKDKIKDFKNAYDDLLKFLPELLLNNAYDVCSNILKDEDKRKNFYKLFLNYSKLLDICQFSEYFIESFEYEEIKKYKDLFKICIALRKRLRITHHEAVDFKEYESKMQKLYDEFVGTDNDVKVLNRIPSIFDADFEKEIAYLNEDKADAVLNASNSVIKERMEENPEMYSKLSEKISVIIVKYQNNRISEEEKLLEAMEIASTIKGENEKENLKYDERIRYNRCARSIYDNSKKYIDNDDTLIDFSLFVDELFKSSSRIPDWQNISSIRNNIEGDIDTKLFELGQDINNKKILSLSNNNQEMISFLQILLKIELNIYKNYSNKSIK